MGRRRHTEVTEGQDLATPCGDGTVDLFCLVSGPGALWVASLSFQLGDKLEAQV